MFFAILDSTYENIILPSIILRKTLLKNFSQYLDFNFSNLEALMVCHFKNNKEINCVGVLLKI